MVYNSVSLILKGNGMVELPIELGVSSFSRFSHKVFPGKCCSNRKGCSDGQMKLQIVLEMSTKLWPCHSFGHCIGRHGGQRTIRSERLQFDTILANEKNRKERRFRKDTASAHAPFPIPSPPSPSFALNGRFQSNYFFSGNFN